MKELSLHILDIAMNSVRGKSTEIAIEVTTSIPENTLTFKIKDNGIGMDASMVASLIDPFTTTRTLRKVGLGIPLLHDTCQLNGGRLIIESEVGVGTTLIATMALQSIDRPPMGDLASTWSGLITSHPDILFYCCYSVENADGEQDDFSISTQDLLDTLEDMPLNHIEVIRWLNAYLSENLTTIQVS